MRKTLEDAKLSHKEMSPLLRMMGDVLHLNVGEVERTAVSHGTD